MKGFKNFFKKLFPCINKTDEDSHVNVDKEFLQDRLNNERQKKLEELRLEELKREAERQELIKETPIQDVIVEETIVVEEAPIAQDVIVEETPVIEEHPEEVPVQEPQVQEPPVEVPVQEPLVEDVQVQEPAELEVDHAHDTRDEMIHCVFLHYSNEYEEFYSTRHTPIHSNFNEKMFKDLCETFTFNTVDELKECLHDYNLMRKQDVKAYRNLSKKRQLKCDLFKFYLFI